jgi:hypothetical protein
MRRLVLILILLVFAGGAAYASFPGSPISGGFGEDVVDTSHMADADHGDISWASGVATVDS